MNDNRDDIMASYYRNLEAMKNRKSEIFYFDEKGNTVDKVHAVKAIVREYDENGELINETFANIGEEESEKEKGEEHRKA